MNPARDARLHILENFPGATIHERGRKYIKLRHPTESFRYMMWCHTGPIHIEGTGTEIDTAWIANDNLNYSQYELKMELADYNAYLGQDANLNFDAANIIKYVHPDSGEELDIFPFPNLVYTNDLNQIQQIGSVQQVEGIVIDDKVVWSGSYGGGFDFVWQTQTARLFKALHISQRSTLPDPMQTIIDGGNPVLKLELQFQKSSGVEVWVNDEVWDEKSTNPQITTDNVEFRLISTNEVLWHFRFPLAWSVGTDTIKPDTIKPVMRLEKRANDLFVKILTPWSWLDAANYPVVIDATINPQVGASADDSRENAAGDCDISATNYLINSPDPEHAAARWAVAVPKDSTINTSYTSWYTDIADRPLEYDVKIESADTAAAYQNNTNDISGRSYESVIDWSGETTTAEAFHDTPSLNTPVSAVISRAGWVSGNYLACAFTESPGESAGMDVIFYDNDSAEAPKLFIDYTSTVEEKLPEKIKIVRSKQIPIHQLQL